jgi:hypothetical protein
MAVEVFGGDVARALRELEPLGADGWQVKARVDNHLILERRKA